MILYELLNSYEITSMKSALFPENSQFLSYLNVNLEYLVKIY